MEKQQFPKESSEKINAAFVSTHGYICNGIANSSVTEADYSYFADYLEWNDLNHVKVVGNVMAELGKYVVRCRKDGMNVHHRRCGYVV